MTSATSDRDRSTPAAVRADLDRYHIEQSFAPVETVVAGDWGFERGLERMTVTPVGGGDARTMTQRALLILRRGADGQWQYARGMTNWFPAAPSGGSSSG